MSNEYDFFMLEPIDPTIGTRMSNLNSKSIGTRSSDNYNQLQLSYGFTMNVTPDPGLGVGARDAIDNPYVAGSSIQRMWDDHLVILGSSMKNGTQVDLPKHDVTDSNLVKDSALSTWKNYPSEGFSRFYIGNPVSYTTAGNSWVRMP